MTMEKDITNLELLRLATELAYADYNNRRANLHNKWVADNEHMQKTRGVSVPYPEIPSYPTEREIVSRAQKLIDFLSHPRADLERKQLQSEVKQLITEVKNELEKDTSIEEPKSTMLDTVPTITDIPSELSENLSNKSEKTSMIGKIKNAWR